MGKENYIFSQMGEEEGDTSDKLSNQFQQLKAVVACRRYLLIYGLNTTIAQLQSFFFLYYYSNKPIARCSFWQETEVTVFTAIENNY